MFLDDRVMAKHLFLLLVILAAGCEQLGPPVNADISTPKSAAMAYLVAIQKGDSRTARALSFGTGEQMGWLDGRLALVNGMRKFDDALYDRFGNLMNQVHTDMHDSLNKFADVWVTSISEGQVSSDGEIAWVDPANKGFFSRSVTSVYLKHFKQGWKVDLARTYAEKIPPSQYSKITEEYRQWKQVGDIFLSVSREVRAGKYQTTDIASAALAERLKNLRAN
jgi:hypothetical protein